MKRKVILALAGGLIFFGGVYFGGLNKETKPQIPVKKEAPVEQEKKVKKVEKKKGLVRNIDYCGGRIFIYFDDCTTYDQVKKFLDSNNLKPMIYFDKIRFGQISVPEGEEIYWVDKFNKDKDSTIVKEACLEYLVDFGSFNN